MGLQTHCTCICCCLGELSHLEWVTCSTYAHLLLSILSRVIGPGDDQGPFQHGYHHSLPKYTLVNSTCISFEMWVLLGILAQMVRSTLKCTGFDVKEHTFPVIYVNYIFLAWKSKSCLNCQFYPLHLGSDVDLKRSHYLGNRLLVCAMEAGWPLLLHSWQSWAYDASRWDTWVLCWVKRIGGRRRRELQKGNCKVRFSRALYA